MIIAKPFSYNKIIYDLPVHYPCVWAVYMYKFMKYLNVVSSEITARPTFTKFPVKPSVKGDLKICFSGYASVTKIVDIPIDVENHSKFSTEPRKHLNSVLV